MPSVFEPGRPETSRYRFFPHKIIKLEGTWLERVTLQGQRDTSFLLISQALGVYFLVKVGNMNQSAIQGGLLIRHTCIIGKMIIAPALLLTLGLQPNYSSCLQSNSASVASNSIVAPFDQSYISVNVKTGDTVSGVIKFRVIVHTDDIVTKVEYYQDGRLQSYQSSTPYDFSLDTTVLKDGDYKVGWIAYTDTGNRIKKDVTLNVNNGLGETPASHVAKGKDLLSQGNTAGAIEEGRVALRIDEKNAPARLLLAQAYYATGKYDQAQNYCDEVLGDNPNDAQALDLASAIGVKEAFGVIAQSSQSDQGLTMIKQAFDYAIDNRTNYLKVLLNGANLADLGPYKYAAVAVKAHQYSLAIQTIQPIFQKNQTDTKAANWLAFCQFREGRFSDATDTLRILKKIGGASSFDAYTKAIQALLAAHNSDNVTADKVLSDAILDDMSNLGVQTSQASVALEENNASALKNLLQSLSAETGNLPEVAYLVSALANQVGNFSAARDQLQQGLLTDAAWDVLYVEAGNQILSTALTHKQSDDTTQMQYKTAQMFFSEGLRAKGDSFRSLTGLAIVSALLKKNDDALKFAQAAVRAQPDYAAGQYALAMALSLSNKNTDASAAMNVASTLDQARLGGEPIPSAAVAWRYFSTGGRALVIAAP